MERTLDVTLRLAGEKSFVVYLNENGTGDTVKKEFPFSGDGRRELGEWVGNELYSWVSLMMDEFVGITVEQECEGCGKHFLVRYCPDGTYDFLEDPCPCRDPFHPVDGKPSISEWLSSIGKGEEDAL